MWINSEQITLLASIGIWFNILGAVLLAKAYAAATDRSLAFQARAYFDISPPALKALCAQRIDARTGISFLFLGFVAELLSSLGLVIHVTFALLLAILVSIAISILYEENRYFWIMKAYVRIANRMGPNGALLPNEQTRRVNFPDVPPDALARALASIR
jgi:hypothetical protein